MEDSNDCNTRLKDKSVNAWLLATEFPKEGSKKLGDILTKQAKQNYKILDKNFKSMVKETKRQWQGMKSDQKNEYRGHTIENTALVSGQLPDHKASTLPDSRKLSNMQSSVPATSSLPAGTEPHKLRKPPPVIPYQRHLEGKRKLAESLRQSGIIPDASDRDRANSLSQVPVGILLNLTPPDTPRFATSADQSSLDHSERASLDSKGSTEASIASGEVATGNLVDLSTPDGNPTKAGGKNGQDSDTESASTISTYSSSDEEGNRQANWEQFDERPPLPPPRSELHHLFSSPGPTPVETPLETPLSSATNPFLSTTTTTQANSNPFQSSDKVVGDSSLDDFSTSIAQALFDTAKRRSDPFAATTLATMSRDIYKTIGEESLPDPLIPTSSSENLNRHPSTALPRSSPHVITDRRSSENVMGIICTRPNSSGSTPNLSVIHPSNSEPTFSSAGNSPVMSQKLATATGTARNFHDVPTSQTSAAAVTGTAHNTHIKPSPIPSPKKPPPPKPQPYSGGAVTFYREKQLGSHQDFPKGNTVSSNGGKTVNNQPYDPFGGLFGDGGMHAYASVKGNSSTANCVQSKESPLV